MSDLSQITAPKKRKVVKRNSSIGMNVGGGAPSNGTGDLLIKKPPQGIREPQSMAKDSHRGTTNHLISTSKKVTSSTPQNNQGAALRSNSLQSGARGGHDSTASNGGGDIPQGEQSQQTIIPLHQQQFNFGNMSKENNQNINNIGLKAAHESKMTSKPPLQISRSTNN